MLCVKCFDAPDAFLAHKMNPDVVSVKVSKNERGVLNRSVELRLLSKKPRLVTAEISIFTLHSSTSSCLHDHPTYLAPQAFASRSLSETIHFLRTHLQAANMGWFWAEPTSKRSAAAVAPHPIPPASAGAAPPVCVLCNLRCRDTNAENSPDAPCTKQTLPAQHHSLPKQTH